MCFCYWSGYDVEVAEEMDGGGEYDEEGEMGYYEENEEYYDDESFDDGTYEDHVSAIQSNGKSQMPHLKPSQSSSNISANQVRELLQSSSKFLFMKFYFNCVPLLSCGHTLLIG